MRRLVLLVVAGALVACPKTPERAHSDAGTASTSASPPASASAGGPLDPGLAQGDADESRPITRRPPSGEPPRLRCDDARALVADVEARLAAPLPPLTKTAAATLDRALADGALDWADPHGLWTASPDSPLAAVLRARASRLRAALEGSAECEAELRPIGEALVKWIADLRRDWDAAAKGDLSGTTPATALAEGVFEDGPLTRPARALVRELATRIATIAKARPELADELEPARDRWLPLLDADAWGEVVLAAAVRAWVPLVDPHGAWAPSDEAAILYDRDLEIAPPPRLWTTSTRTAIGVRIDGGTLAPLEEGDVVLSIDGVTLAGLSAEAIDQLAESPEGVEPAPRVVRVLRASKPSGAKAAGPRPLRVVRLEVRPGAIDALAPPEPLASEVVPYGDGDVLVVRIPDVPDGLGDDLARTIAAVKGDDGEPTVRGLVLDLRGNGGGSIDGASATLGLFLPGAPLFPLKHRDGAIETERATEPPIEDRWSGPIAALVDGGTASAAEMIAGALHAYRRGVVIGSTTYGKGCAQEYVDDAIGGGVLRITTLLFALPDGTAVQRVGLRPDLAIPLPAPFGVKDREADLPRSPPTWIGPDVRDPKRVAEVPWPPAKAVGPCKDEVLCRALRALSIARHDVAKR